MLLMSSRLISSICGFGARRSSDGMHFAEKWIGTRYDAAYLGTNSISYLDPSAVRMFFMTFGAPSLDAMKPNISW